MIGQTPDPRFSKVPLVLGALAATVSAVAATPAAAAVKPSMHLASGHHLSRHINPISCYFVKVK